MPIPQEARYRLNLAEGFLLEAREDMGTKRWRSCVDNSQLAVENAAKAMLALLGPVGRVHHPAVLLQRAL
jgi:HEPN domain-containing protein